MIKCLQCVTLCLALAAGSVVHAQFGLDGEVMPDSQLGALSTLFLSERDALDLPGLRPRLTMSVPLGAQAGADGNRAGPFSWSLEAWQLNTASLAHIQCHRLTPTVDSYLAEDCRFVDQPIPEHAVNLVQVRGEWKAAPGLNIGIGAFSRQSGPQGPAFGLAALQTQGASMASMPLATRPTEGMDLNISFGIAHDRIGDFLVGLQLARYRQRTSLLDFGMDNPGPPLGLYAGDFDRYGNSAQLAVGWRRGSFSGDLLASSREVPLYLGPGQYAQAPLNSFDLEFSWRAVRNASITIGVTNLLDAAPRAVDDSAMDPGIEDPLEHVFGRIPYVRYKHDL